MAVRVPGWDAHYQRTSCATVGKPVKLIMASEDVIHSFFVPSFRIKMDVLPNRYTELWFQPEQEGVHALMCAEYCGLKPLRYDGADSSLTARRSLRGLAGARRREQHASMPLAELGLILYESRGMRHLPLVWTDRRGEGPSFQGIFGRCPENERRHVGGGG